MPAYPDIHYAWVGPPSALNPKSIPGHDIAGPISLAKEFQKDIYKDKNKIKFWCLRKYHDYYQQLYIKQGVDIEVCSIESLFERFNALPPNLVEILQSEPANIKDLINFKDQFSLFLLTEKPGYFFDTNIFPKQGHKLNLPSQENFATAQGPEKSNDFYLMYSPQGDQKSVKAFSQRIKTPFEAATFAFDNLSVPYLDLDNLGVEKTSYKSYIEFSKPGFFRLLDFNFKKFKEHSQFADLDQQMPCPFSLSSIIDSTTARLANVEGGTLLHHAVMINDIQKVTWLIQMGVRLDLRATYQIQPSESGLRYEYTPLELSKFLKHDAIADALQKQAKQQTAEKFADTFFKFNQNEQSQILHNFEQKILG